MESQNQSGGFWSQLTPVSKFLIFLLVLGILGASAYYIFMGKETQPAADSSAVATDSVSSAASDGISTNQPSNDAPTPVENTAKDENVAADTKATEPAVVAAGSAVVASKAAETKKAAVLPKSKKPVTIVKKRTDKAEDTKPKKKSKNNEDVEVDI